ncbi:MAG: GTPase HflX [Methanomassiliicoccales archaeon]
MSLEGERTAVIVTLSEDLREFEELADSAGYRVLYEVIQRRKSPHTATFLGKGKLRELNELVEEWPVDAILINGDLKPTQHFNLESELKKECVDRIGVVLSIFASKARDKKAKLQVEKARLEYELPFLREWIHNARMGEHPGFLSGGEYQVDVYYELVKRRIKKINEELKTINQGQELRREQRRKRGFLLVSIAGYTNAGKSSLLKRLTGEQVSIDRRMFSTLSTTTRRLEGVNRDILLTDTIGFLQNLPHFMIESFATSIEDIYLSDLILLVIDASESLDSMERKIETSSKILFPTVDTSEVMVVLNKVDAVEGDLQRRIDLTEELLPGCKVIPVSVLEDHGVKDLIGSIVSFFQYQCRIDFLAPNSSTTSSLVSRLYEKGEVRKVVYGNQVKVSANCRMRDYDRFLGMIAEAGGEVLYSTSGDSIRTAASGRA